MLQKPDFARARPSTLLTDEDTYSELYEKNQDLEIFYKAARIGRAVKNNLRLTSEITTAERSDILFYLIYAVVSNRLQKKNISFSDIKTFDIDSLSDEEIDKIKSAVYSKYKELGGNGRVAKSSTFINDIIQVIGIE